MEACICSRVGMEVESAIDEMTAEARGSSGLVLSEGWDLGFEGDGCMALVVSARMAFWDFLVPKARPRFERADRACRWMGVLV